MDYAHLSPAETSAAVSVQMEGIACIHMVPTHNLNITMMNYHSNNVVMPTNYCHGNKQILLCNQWRSYSGALAPPSASVAPPSANQFIT